MRTTDRDRRAVHPDSPVQPGRDFPALILVLAAVAAISVWSLMQSDGFEQPDRQSASAENETATALVPANANLAAYFSSEDYPSAALRREETGTVAFRLDIDQRGRVRDCTIVESSGSASLDRATCSILQRRARFTPARDEAGVAVADTTTGRIRWELPKA